MLINISTTSMYNNYILINLKGKFVFFIRISIIQFQGRSINC